MTFVQVHTASLAWAPSTLVVNMPGFAPRARGQENTHTYKE
jgi:hypothetical protein